MTGASVAGRVNVGDFVTIGTNATILPDIKIGSGSYIGAGSVVIKSVKKNTIVVGNPAKKIKSNKQKFDISYFK
jgi:acetyltransferase-like isoleucine patch superfamily enzyme